MSYVHGYGYYPRKKAFFKRTVITLVILGILLCCACAGCVYIINLVIGRQNTYEQYLPASQFTDEWLENTDIKAVRVKSNDNLSLSAVEYLPSGADNNKWVIVCHGYGSNGAEMSGYAEKYCNTGFNVLAPDMRAHGASEGTYAGMGLLDSQDLLVWIDFLTENYPNSKIILHGISMGATAVMMAAGNPDISDSVAACIEECGFTSAKDIFSFQLKKRFSLPDSLISIALGVLDPFSKLLAGYSFSEADCLPAVQNVKMPILFIHGDADTVVPPEMVFILYNACASPNKKLCLIENAEHTKSSITDPELYWTEVFDFIENTI